MGCWERTFDVDKVYIEYDAGMGQKVSRGTPAASQGPTLPWRETSND
jgi:hypothetical protein